MLYLNASTVISFKYTPLYLTLTNVVFECEVAEMFLKSKDTI